MCASFTCTLYILLGVSLQGLEVVLELGLQVGRGGAHQVVHVHRLISETSTEGWKILNEPEFVKVAKFKLRHVSLTLLHCNKIRKKRKKSGYYKFFVQYFTKNLSCCFLNFKKIHI
jgi:hypothetical protein